MLTAAQQGHCQIFLSLLAKLDIRIADSILHGLFLEACESGQGSIVSMLLDLGVLVDATEHSPITGLSRAASMGHTNVVEILLTHRAAPQFDNILESPLYVAAGRGFMQCARVLFNHGAYKKVDIPPFVVAAQRGQAEMVVFLLEQGANLQHSGRMALNMAAGAGYESVVRILVDRGVPVNYDDEIEQCPPLLEALKHRQFHVAKALVELGARRVGQASMEHWAASNARAGAEDESKIAAMHHGYLTIF